MASERSQVLSCFRPRLFIHLYHVDPDTVPRCTGLENMFKLEVLDLASNFISKIEGLAECKSLNTLLLSRNKLASCEAIAGVRKPILDRTLRWSDRSAHFA